MVARAAFFEKKCTDRRSEGLACIVSRDSAGATVQYSLPGAKAVKRKVRGNAIRANSARHDCAVAGPLAQRADGLGARDGERLRGLQLLDDDRRADLHAARERGVEAGDHRLLDLRAAETVGGGGEAREVEELRVALPLAEMDREDLLSLVAVGDVHHADLVEAS